jgi:hypothetical protein
MTITGMGNPISIAALVDTNHEHYERGQIWVFFFMKDNIQRTKTKKWSLHGSGHLKNTHSPEGLFTTLVDNAARPTKQG